MMTAAIEARGLAKSFDGRVAVDDLTFDVARGEVFGFLGPNGAGKTTTVRMLTTLLRPTAGTASVAGIPIGSGPELRGRVAVMPETPGLYLKLSIYENLEFFAGLYGVPPAAARSRIMSSLDAVGLAERHADLAGSLSKGLRQRAALARTLISDPEILFLDEPTVGLDPAASVEVRDLIDGLRSRGLTVFLTTHRLEEAEKLCDRVAILSTRLLSMGRPEELRLAAFASAVDVVTRVPLADPEAIFGGISGVKEWTADGSHYRVAAPSPSDIAPEIARAVIDAGADLVRLAEVSRSLEETYLRLIEEEA